MGFPAQTLSALDGAGGAPDLVVLNDTLIVEGMMVGVSFYALSTGPFWVGVWAALEDTRLNLTGKVKVTADATGMQNVMFSDDDFLDVST